MKLLTFENAGRFIQLGTFIEMEDESGFPFSIGIDHGLYDAELWKAGVANKNENFISK